MLGQIGRAAMKIPINAMLKRLAAYSSSERVLILQGTIASKQVRSLSKIRNLADVEFSVFSQWGEDGIIEWLIEKLTADLPETFIEFGVENYREANTRFLLCHRNWRGLVIDGSQSNIETIRADNISWRHDLTAKCAFITAENIDQLIVEAGFEGEIGLLSVDIDGNDYWVWKAITAVRPHIVVVEYNANFGDLIPLTIPYDPSFVRTSAHRSNLYWGASIRALCDLAREKGYTFTGTNNAGSNAFFVRDDRAITIMPLIADVAPWPSRARESRDDSGRLTLVRGESRGTVISDCLTVDVSNGRTDRLGAFDPIYSSRWLAMLEGGAPKAD